MEGIIRVKRIKINKNLGTIDDFKPDVCIDYETNTPIRWETYSFKPKRKEYLFTKLYLSSGESILLEMSIAQWEEYYGKFIEVYELAIENRNPAPILEA